MGQRAAEMAFVQVAAGAFQMPAHHVIAPLVAEEESGPAESSTTGEGRDNRRSETFEVSPSVSPRKFPHRFPNRKRRPLFGVWITGVMGQRNGELSRRALALEG